MTLQDNICDVVRNEALPARAIAARLMLPIQDVCKAIVELIARKRIRRAGVVVEKTKTITKKLDTYIVVAPKPKRDNHADKMKRLHREFFGEAS